MINRKNTIVEDFLAEVHSLHNRLAYKNVEKLLFIKN